MKILKASSLTLRDIKKKLDVHFTEDLDFFPEWKETEMEVENEIKQLLQKLKKGYLNLREKSTVLESSVRMTVIDPLLFIEGFFLPPYEVRTEEPIAIATVDEGEIIQGRIDFLVLKDSFWVLVIESKQLIYSVDLGLPQILAYMRVTPNQEQGVFGLITNGGEFLFVKLKGNKYGTSELFSMRNSGDLEKVFLILKKLCEIYG